jgi:hypothetical protein
MLQEKYFSQVFPCDVLFGTVLSAVVGIWMAYSGFGVWALERIPCSITTVDTIVLGIR